MTMRTTMTSPVDAPNHHHQHHHQQQQHHHHLVHSVQRPLLDAAILLACGWMILWASSSSPNHTAAWTIVRDYHEPSNRIFRSVWHITLVLGGGAASLWVWQRYLVVLQEDGEDQEDKTTTGDTYDTTVADLLFGPVEEEDEQHRSFVGEEDSDDEDDDEDDVEADMDRGREDDISFDPTTLSTGTRRKNDDDNPSRRLPSPLVVLALALNLGRTILVALVLYTVTTLWAVSTRPTIATTATPSLSHTVSRLAAPTIPLLLLLYVGLQCAGIPTGRSILGDDRGAASGSDRDGRRWSRPGTLHSPLSWRRPLVSVVWRTLQAPALPVTFRDGMIGDVLTSTVRPLQDMAFTLCYLLFGLHGWWQYNTAYSNYATDSNNNDNAFLHIPTTWNDTTQVLVDPLDAMDAATATPTLEQSWLLHTILLPACMVSPLGWRFLQTLRQVHDTRQRWPYLGNSLKYFGAAQVAMVGVYHPQLKENPVWIASFVAATVYQIWWDVEMDWGLWEPVPPTATVQRQENNLHRSGGGGAAADGASRRFGWWWQGRRRQLRRTRYYPTYFYPTLAIVNALLRFCWTLSFVPTRYLAVGGLVGGGHGSSHYHHVARLVGDHWDLGPLLASAEILRRTLWGFLRVEWQVIQTKRHEHSGIGRSDMDDANSDDGMEKPSDIIDAGSLEMTPMSVQVHTPSLAWSDLRMPSSMSGGSADGWKLFRSDMTGMNSVQILAELCFYTAVFAVLSLVTAAHRETY